MRSAVVLPIGLFVVGLFVAGDARAQVLTAPLVVDQRQDMPARPKNTVPGPAERAPSANPLWAIPLGQLTATRERPLFTPSRRPPPPPVVAKAGPPPPPPPPKPPEPLQLSLVGTIVGEDGESIGLFSSPGERSGVRLKTGEEYKGWVLRTVRSREVMLARGPESAVLELPRREASKGGSALTTVDSVPPPDAVKNQRMEIDPVETASSPIEASAPIEASSPINSPKPRGGFSPPRAAEMPMIDQRGVASVVQPPAIVAPAALANPFQKAWLR